MSTIVLFVFAIFIALFIGFIIGKYLLNSTVQETKNLFQKQLEFTENHLNETKNQLSKIQIDKEELVILLAKKENDFDNLLERNKEQKKELLDLQERFGLEFENLANKIFEEKSSKFTEQNKENLKNILSPLQEKIMHFEKKVDDSQKETFGYHSALKEQLQHLKDQSFKITKETENLTKALKGDNKTQGNWGELILERVLEKSGLEKGREYEIQQSFTNDNGIRQQPDVIIYLPDNKKMIIDAKVSLIAYEKYINEENESLKLNFLKEHLFSIKRHIEQLSSKNYYDIYQMESPDFVLLFIPIEPAFALAINEDNTLYNKAFERNIVIVTPATLLATLRTIDSMWANQKQQQNALEIAKQAGALYDKFEGFVNDLIKIGKKMDDAKTEYQSAMNKLVEGKGNLISSVEKIKKMGAKAKKSLPETIKNRAENNTKDQLN